METPCLYMVMERRKNVNKEHEGRGSKYRDIQSGIGLDFFKGNNISVFIIPNIDK